MKPVKLTIEGINSFTDPQTLDFEAVGRNNLFCISGKTGAGKTTIFDSIMFALYGKSGKGNLADVVNLSRMSARVVFDFTANGDMYSVERTIKCRAEKDADGKPTDRRVANGDCMLYKNGAPHAKGEEATAQLESIIGLEADEFKNVYLLEQGEYAKFLKKTPAKQTEAVGKIFSLMRFGDVHKLAGERKRDKEKSASDVEVRIRDLGDISPAKLNDEKKALAAVRAKTTALKKEYEVKRGALDELNKARDLYISVLEKQNAVRTLALQEDEAKKAQFAAQSELAEFEKNIDPNFGKQLAELRTKLNELSALNSLDNEYSTLVEDIRSKKSDLDGKLKKAEELDRVRRDLKARRTAMDGEFTVKLGEIVDKAALITDKSDALTSAVATLGGDKVGNTELTDIIYALETEKRSYDGFVELRKKHAAALTDVQAKCDDALKIIERYESEYKRLCEQKREAAENEARAQKALAAAQLNSHAAAIRAELHDGDTCPVCGGAYSECGALGDSDVDKRKSERDEAVALLKNATEKETECAKHLDREKNEYARAIADRDKIKAEIVAAENGMAQTKVVPDIYS
ncbi:MAG: SMC family ATPase, partial [Clostridiales bacterium]|nr:SMC family ATPase [Clostridiales bacterium]